MANPEHVALLQQGTKVWNQWRREHPQERPDLSNADLRGADLLHADLLHAYLIGADLRGADLRGADLLGADLIGANLRGADLLGANLSDANLSLADFIGANLRGVNLRGAYLITADLRDANLTGANLTGANLRGANLRGANLIVVEYELPSDSMAVDMDLRVLGRMEAELKEAERKEAKRKEAKRKEAERKEAERKEAERKEVVRRKSENKFTLSFTHPHVLAKGESARYLIVLYLPTFRHEVDRVKIITFDGKPIDETLRDTDVAQNVTVIIDLSSPAVEFSKEKKVQLSREVNDVLFLGMPNDNCKPGQQEVLITITDAEYGFEYNAFPVQVQVVDYQFDHVSRPMFQRAVSLISATSAVIMWALSFLEQIDKSWGLPAGAAAAAVAAFFVYQLTQLTKTTTTNIP